MMRKRTLCPAGLLSAAALVACGEDGVTAAVPLKSEADIAREIANVVVLQGGGQALEPTPLATVPANGKAAGAWPEPAFPMGPRSVETTQCDSGSFTFETLTERTRHLPLFDVDGIFGIDITHARACRFDYGYVVTTEDGRSETGATPDDGMEGAHYYYAVAGTALAPHVIRYDFFDGSTVTRRRQGRHENRLDTCCEFREVLETDFVVARNGETQRFSVDTGEQGNPLTLSYAFQPLQLTIDGPVRYSSSFCEGGRLEYDTLEALTFDRDDAGAFVNGGVLAITAGDRSVTLTFLANGDVNYLFADGTSGTIARGGLPGPRRCLSAEWPDALS